MNFTEKLKRVAAEVNKSKVSEAVGLKPTTISNYIAKGSIPRADIALKIAKALAVPLDWLVDDNKDWPPPTPHRTVDSGVKMATDQKLIDELLGRLWMAEMTITEQLNHAEKVDWRALRHRAEALPEAEPLPRDLKHQFRLIHYLSTSLPRFEILETVRPLAELCGDVMTEGGHEHLDSEKLLTRFDQLSLNEDLKAFVRAAGSRPMSDAERSKFESLLLVAFRGGALKNEPPQD